MPARPIRTLLSCVLAPAALLYALYFGMGMRSWSIDGCWMVQDSGIFADVHAYGHFLLRPLVYLSVTFGRGVGFDSPGQSYDALWAVFTTLGIVALVILFNLARARGAGGGAAGMILIFGALSRNAIRACSTLDEKGLGLFGMALALAATAAMLRAAGRAEAPETSHEGGRESSRPARRNGPLPIGRLSLACAAWVFAVFCHLQNAPYAIFFVIMLACWMPWPIARRIGIASGAAMGAALLGLAAFVAIHWGQGGWRALPQLVQLLRGGHPDLARAGLAASFRDAAEGWIKAWFVVDRLSARAFVALSLIGFVLLVPGALWGFMRGLARRDPLDKMLLGGSALLMTMIPLTYNHPKMGDSFTMLLPAAMLLLARAPRALLASLAAIMIVVTIPNQIEVAWPPVTVQEDLAALGKVQARNGGAAWMIFDELSVSGGVQELCPAFYPMRPDLRVEHASLARPPAGRFLVEIPLAMAEDGQLETRRLDEIQERFAALGRNVRVESFWPGPRLIRTDWRAYGYYMVVEPELTLPPPH